MGVTKNMDGRISVAEAARMLSMSMPTLRQAVEEGKLDIGYCTKSPRSRRRDFFLYKALVEKEAERLKGKGSTWNQSTATA